MNIGQDVPSLVFMMAMEEVLVPIILEIICINLLLKKVLFLAIQKKHCKMDLQMLKRNS
jgi:hypothetical protein